MVWATNDAPIQDMKEFAVLVSLADKAGPDGCDAFPAVATIARRIGGSERSVQRALDGLRSRRIIAEGDQSAARYLRVDRKPTVYDLLIPYTWFSNVERINLERERMGRPPLTPLDRPDFTGCHSVAPDETVITGLGVTESLSRGDGESFAGCQPDTRTSPLNRSEGTGKTHSADAKREGVQGWSPQETETRIAELCRLLVDQVKANGAKPPKITYAWKNAARDLLGGEDAYTYEQVRDGICWAQADNFWASRTTTMAKLAKHFDQIIIRARKDQQDTSTPQGKQAQQDLMSRRLETMQKLMDLYEAKVKRPMTDSERERLKARVKEEIQ